MLVLSPALVYLARKGLADNTKDGRLVAGERDDFLTPNDIATKSILEDAPTGTATASVGGISPGLEKETDCSSRDELADKARAGRVPMSQLSGEVEANKSNYISGDSSFRGNVDKPMVQQFHPPAPTDEGPNAVAATPAAVTVGPKHLTTENTKNDVALNSTHLVGHLFGELPWKDQVLLLATMLQNAHLDLSSTVGHPRDPESVLQQPVTVPPLSVHMRPSGETDATLIPLTSVDSAAGERTDGESKPVGPAAARSAAAAAQHSAVPVSSPPPLTALSSPVPTQPLSPVAPSFRMQLPQTLSPSVSTSSELPVYHAPLVPVNLDGNIDPPLLPHSFGPPEANVYDSQEAIKALTVTAPLGHLPLNAGPPVDPSLRSQQTFLPAAASTRNAPTGPSPTGRMYHYSGVTMAPFYLSSHTRRSPTPAAYVSSAILTSPLMAGPVSPTAVGARVSNAVGTAVGHTTQLVDDTLRSAILNVVNPATYGATSLLHGIQALNQKLQAGSDVATKALLDFAAYRRNNPHHSLAEFINTLEEVTDTLNQAATTAPDPRLQSKIAAQAEVTDNAHVVGGELLEGMEYNPSSSSSGREESTASSREGSPSAWSSHQTRSSVTTKGTPPPETQEQPSSQRLTTNRNWITSPKSSYSVPLTENTTQTINLRDVLSTEQLQLMEVLTDVLNVGFDAALGFVKRQERGIAGLKQFPFFKPLQQRVIQAAHRAGDRAAADRAAPDRAAVHWQFASGAESTTLDGNLHGTEHTLAAARLLPDNYAQDDSDTLSLTNQRGSWGSTTATRVVSFREEVHPTQWQAHANVILPTWTASNAQLKPHETLGTSERLHSAAHPVRQQHQQGHMWLTNSSVGQQRPTPPHVAPVHHLKPAALYNTQSHSAPHVASLERVLSPRGLPHTRIQSQGNSMRPASPTHVESQVLDVDGSQRHQEQQWHPQQQRHQRQQRHRQPPEPNNVAGSSFHNASAPALLLGQKRPTIDLLQKPVSGGVPPTISLTPPAFLNAPIDATSLHTASGEKLSATCAGPVRKLAVASRNHGRVDDAAGVQLRPSLVPEREPHTDSSEDAVSRVGRAVPQESNSRTALLDQSFQQSLFKSAERLLPGHVEFSGPFVRSEALPTSNGAFESTHIKSIKSGGQRAEWVANASKSIHDEGLPEGGAVCTRCSEEQAVHKFVTEKKVSPVKAGANSEVLSRAYATRTQAPLPLKVDGGKMTAPAVTICHAPHSSEETSALRQKISLTERKVRRIRRLAQCNPLAPSTSASPIPSIGEKVSRIRRLAPRDRLASSTAAAEIPLAENKAGTTRRLAQRNPLASPAGVVEIAAAAAASTLPAAVPGVAASPTAAEKVFSHAGLQEQCVLSGVRYKGLASVVDRRSSLASCQAACRTTAAAVAVAPRTELSVLSASPGPADASLVYSSNAAVRPVAAPCRFTSYLTEVGLCYQYATVESLIPAAGYISAPITCSMVETGGGAQARAQQLPQVSTSLSQRYASPAPLELAGASSTQVTPPNWGHQQQQSSQSAHSTPAQGQQQQWTTQTQHSVPLEQATQQNVVVGEATASAPLHSMSDSEGKPYLVTKQYASTHAVQPSYSTVSAQHTAATSSAQSADLEEQPTFIKEPEALDKSSQVGESLGHQAGLQTVVPSLQNRGVPGLPQFKQPFVPSEPPSMQRGDEAELLQNGWADITDTQRLFFNNDPRGLQLTGQQAAFAPGSAILPASGAFVNGELYAGLADVASGPTVSSVAASIPLGPSPTGASNVAHALTPAAIATTAVGAGVPLVPLPSTQPSITAFSALPPLPSITTPIAGTASSILQTAQGLMQTGNALMQAFPLQQLLDAGQQLYASGFFRNRGMKHLQLPFLGQQKQELPPPPGMERPTVACATEGMTCCVPENAAEKWKERPPYLNNHEWDKKCRAHFVSMTNSLCATTSYVLKGKGRRTNGTEVQTTADTNLLPTSEDEVDHCGLVLTETRDFWVFRHTLVIPGRSMNNAICECKEPKIPNQEGLRQIEGFATWEFSLQAVHDMEAQVERGEKIAKGLGTALALTTVLGRQGEEALGHMLEHTNTGRA